MLGLRQEGPYTLSVPFAATPGRFLRDHDTVKALLALWAKLGTATFPQCYHPLLFHLIDVAAVAAQLWDCILRAPVKDSFADSVGLSSEDCGAWVAFCVGAHDIGKASPGFEQRQNATELVELLRRDGFDFSASRPVHHATVSVPVLAAWLQERKVPKRTARRIALAVGGHHGTFPRSGWDQLGSAVLGNDRWHEVRRTLLNTLATLLALPGNRPPRAGDGDDQSYLMTLAGLTSVADWVGSNQDFFPAAGNPGNYLDASDRRIQDYLDYSRRQAAAALQALGWLRSNALAVRQPPFTELFAYLPLGKPRPLQAAVERLAAQREAAGLLLVEAPMGEGKTEAALYLADAWERRGGQGLYVALPTMATSNGMFARLEQFLRSNYPGRVNLHLLHGQALLSAAYQRLARRAADSGFPAEQYDDDAAPSAVVADAWFAQDRKHALLAPFAVGTLDQALLSVLQTRHNFVRLFGLAGKTVILDEVHAYDVYTSALLKHLLRWLAALGCPVILLSATLPKQKRAELLEAYSGCSIPAGAAPPRYPRLSLVTRGESPSVESEHVPASPDTSKELRFAWQDDDMQALAPRLARALQHGGCAAVIRNTVGQAQDTYRALKRQLPSDVDLELFHARFLFARRQEIEQGVLRRYGKEGPRPHKAVLVATQVIEQSLDLDFDLMVTDVAPIDLVLQRAGRLWRHSRPRPAGLAGPIVWLLRPRPRADGVPTFGASEYVYESSVLLRSFVRLGEHVDADTPVRLPADVEGLIEHVYGGNDEAALDPAWQEALARADAAMQAKQAEDALAARAFLIGQPAEENEILAEFSQQLEEDNPDLPRERQAFTRLVRPSISLVFLYEIDDRHYLDPGGQHRVNLKRRPTLADARAYLNNAVTIQRAGCVFHYATQAAPAAWRQSGLLRFSRVVRVSADGTALPGEYPLAVDPEFGVYFPQADGPRGAPDADPV